MKTSSTLPLNPYPCWPALSGMLLNFNSMMIIGIYFLNFAFLNVCGRSPVFTSSSGLYSACPNKISSNKTVLNAVTRAAVEVAFCSIWRAAFKYGFTQRAYNLTVLTWLFKYVFSISYLLRSSFSDSSSHLKNSPILCCNMRLTLSFKSKESTFFKESAAMNASINVTY